MDKYIEVLMGGDQVLAGIHYVQALGLFNYNFNQDVAGRTIAYLASILQFHYVAGSYPGRNLHL